MTMNTRTIMHTTYQCGPTIPCGPNEIIDVGSDVLNDLEILAVHFAKQRKKD